MEPDRAEVERFLTALDPNAIRWTFQTFDDSKERREERKARGEKIDPVAKIIHGTLKGHWRELVKLNAQGAGIFVTVNETDFKGRTAENIKNVRALFVDLDGSPLDPVLADDVPKPHIITETSPGRWHAYWCVGGYLDEVYADDFTPLQKSIAARFGGDPTVHDLPRVMRLPGFVHFKGEPFLSRIVQINSIPKYRGPAILEAFPFVADAEPADDDEPAATTASGQSKRKALRWGRA
jgi:putative DNA primase/helicase